MQPDIPLRIDIGPCLIAIVAFDDGDRHHGAHRQLPPQIRIDAGVFAGTSTTAPGNNSNVHESLRTAATRAGTTMPLA